MYILLCLCDYLNNYLLHIFNYLSPLHVVRTMLEAIISFFPTPGGGAIGALDWTKAERQALAKQSHEYTCSVCGQVSLLLSSEMAEKEDGQGNKLQEEEEEEVSKDIQDQVKQLCLVAPSDISAGVDISNKKEMEVTTASTNTTESEDTVDITNTNTNTHTMSTEQPPPQQVQAVNTHVGEKVVKTTNTTTTTIVPPPPLSPLPQQQEEPYDWMDTIYMIIMSVIAIIILYLIIRKYNILVLNSTNNNIPSL